MQFGRTVGTACSSFAITNIDDIFVLVTFFAEASTKKTTTPWKITLGQYLGFTIIIVVSMIGFGASLVLPAEPIGFLGLLPILLGVWNLLKVILRDDDGDDDETAALSKVSGIKVITKVAAITVMNGGDNVGTYIPLFAQANGAEIAVYVVVFYILLGVWCLAAFLVMKQRHILLAAKKYARLFIPFLYMGLGIFIIIKSSCYPWSIEHINKSTAPRHPGTTIMAVTTTGLLLLCIGAMLVLKLRRPLPNRDSHSQGADEEAIDNENENEDQNGHGQQIELPPTRPSLVSSRHGQRDSHPDGGLCDTAVVSKTSGLPLSSVSSTGTNAPP